MAVDVRAVTLVQRGYIGTAWPGRSAAPPRLFLRLWEYVILI